MRFYREGCSIFDWADNNLLIDTYADEEQAQAVLDLLNSAADNLDKVLAALKFFRRDQ